MNFLIVAAIVAVALAQPTVKAPQLPQVNYIAGSGSDAVVTAVVAANYVFTADKNGVWGANVSKSSNEVTPFWDAIVGVTQLFGWCGNWSVSSTCAVHAIAGSAVVMYRMNETAIWRESIYQVNNASFDTLSYTRSYTPPVVIPNAAGTSAFFVLGTRNTSTFALGTFSPSTVYAFDVWDLSVAWSTIVNADTTSFPIANCTEFVWVLSQNNTVNGASNVVVRKLHRSNGTILDWWFDSSISSSLSYLGVAQGQFMVLGSGGYITLALYNGTIMTLGYSIPSSCNTMPYVPVVINSTWYAICGPYVEMFDVETGEQQPAFVTADAATNFDCLALHEANGDFVLTAPGFVFVGSASGISQLLELPTQLNGGPPRSCIGARFNWASPQFVTLWNDVTNIVHLSYPGAYGGVVIALNYRTGEVIHQAAADLIPVGPGVIDWTERRLFVSSSSGNVLQGYELIAPTNEANALSFVSNLGGSGSSTTTFSVAYNATSRSTYYISAYHLSIVDSTGANEMLVTFDFVSISLMPVIVGQFLVFCDSYNDLVLVYDSVTKALTSLAIETLDTYAQPYVFGMTVVVFVIDYFIAAVAIDLSATTIAAVSIPGDSYTKVSGAALVGTTLVINTGASQVSGFDTLRSTYSSTHFVLTQEKEGLYTLQSAPVAYNGLAYFVSRTVSVLEDDGNNVVFSVSASGSLTKVGDLMTQMATEVKVLRIMSGGFFGGAAMYIIGSQNVTAYTTNWTTMFNYESSDTIITSLPLTPTVLDTGAICFHTANAFTVVGGFEGEVAWSYDTPSTVYPALTDNTTIFFSNGMFVIGADTYSGAVTSLSTFGINALRGFAIAAGLNSTTIVGATEAELLFASQVLRSQPASAGITARFPGSGSFPSGSGAFSSSGASSDAPTSKLWIYVGAGLGALVLVVFVVVLACRRSSPPKSNDLYVPMNPAVYA